MAYEEILTKTAGDSYYLPKNTTIPTVYNGKLTIKTNDNVKDVFTANQNGDTTINITPSDLGLSSAMKFLGVSTTAITDHGTEHPTINGSAVIPTAGNVVIYNHLEFVWSSDNKWEQLGDESSYALKTSIGNGTITIKQAGSTKGTFTVNQSGNTTIELTDTNTNTDTKVTQTITTANAAYPLLLAPSGQTSTATTTSYFDSGVTLNPSNNTIAANISGNAASASAVAWGGVTGKPSTFPPSSHTHNYAGSSSAGGPANSLSYFQNTSSTNVGQAESGSNGIAYITDYSGSAITSNVKDGALYRQAYSTSWVHQIYGDYRSGSIAVRGKNNGTWQAWHRVLDESNYNSYAPTKTGGGASGTWSINVTGSAGSVAWGNVTNKPTIPAAANNATITINQNGNKAGSFTLNQSAAATIDLTDTTYSAGTALTLTGTTFNHNSYATAGTIGTASGTSGSSLAVPYITVNAQGHVTGYGTHTHTISGFLTTVTKANVTNALGYTPCRAWTVTLPSGSSGSKAITVSGATFGKSPLIAKSSGSDTDYNKITAVSAATNSLTFTLSSATSAALTLMVIETF